MLQGWYKLLPLKEEFGMPPMWTSRLNSNSTAQCTSTLPLAGGQLKVTEKTLAGHIE